MRCQVAGQIRSCCTHTWIQDIGSRSPRVGDDEASEPAPTTVTPSSEPATDEQATAPVVITFEVGTGPNDRE